MQSKGLNEKVKCQPPPNHQTSLSLFLLWAWRAESNDLPVASLSQRRCATPIARLGEGASESHSPKLKRYIKSGELMVYVYGLWWMLDMKSTSFNGLSKYGGLENK